MGWTNGYNQDELQASVAEYHEEEIARLVEQAVEEHSWENRDDTAARLEGISWYLPGQTRLEAIEAHVTEDPKGLYPGDPWRTGYEMEIRSQGWDVSRDRHRKLYVGDKGYMGYGGGHRTLRATHADHTASKSEVVVIGKSGDVGETKADWGKDSLHVKGDAHYEFHSRMIIMSGEIRRTWNGGIVRMVSMEGTMCAGAFVRTIASPSMNLSTMATGDVYIAAARVAGIRVLMAVMQYRASALTAWACGVYSRIASAVIEPVVGTTQQSKPAGRVMAKLNKIVGASRVAKVAKVLTALKAIFPPAEILAGIFIGLPMLVALPFMMIAGKLWPNPAPPVIGPPRVHNRVCGISTETFVSMMYL